MSKPTRQTTEYGFNPNLAESTPAMESVVTNAGMQMAGNVEKHSEHMFPDKPYDELEDEYPYPLNLMAPMDPIWPVFPGWNWPITKAPVSAERVFRCVANYCCCEGNLIGPVNITCTYPIVMGPWVKNDDGTKCPSIVPKGSLDASSVSCISPCGDGSCPPDIRVIVEAPALTVGSKKYPAVRQEVKVHMLNNCGAVGDPPCPPVGGNCGAVAISGIPQMSINTSQTLGILNPVSGHTYIFRKTAGGGTLTGSIYYAPDANVNCSSNATIGLYDEQTCMLCDTISIAINNPSVAGIAYNEVTRCPFHSPYAEGTYYYCCAPRNCDGTLVTGTGSSSCNAPAYEGFGCSNTYPANTATIAWNEGQPAGCVTGDVRTVEMKAAGCCPTQLF